MYLLMCTTCQMIKSRIQFMSSVITGNLKYFNLYHFTSVSGSFSTMSLLSIISLIPDLLVAKPVKHYKIKENKINCKGYIVCIEFEMSMTVYILSLLVSLQSCLVNV